MGFLDVLAKLGILRMGSKSATYENATERPAELMMDDVYDAKRDLAAGGDARASAKSAAKHERKFKAS